MAKHPHYDAAPLIESYKVDSNTGNIILTTRAIPDMDIKASLLQEIEGLKARHHMNIGLADIGNDQIAITIAEGETAKKALVATQIFTRKVQTLDMLASRAFIPYAYSGVAKKAIGEMQSVAEMKGEQQGALQIGALIKSIDQVRGL